MKQRFRLDAAYKYGRRHQLITKERGITVNHGRSSYTADEGSHVDAVVIEAAGERYRRILQGIEDAKVEIHNQMIGVAEAFWRDREEAIAAEKAMVIPPNKPRFIALTISVSNAKGTSLARWMDVHFRNGKKTGAISRRATKGTGQYHLASLKQGIPDTLHHAIESAELKLRELRKQQRQLSLAKRRLRERAKAAPATWPPPPDLEGFDWDAAFPVRPDDLG